MPLYEYHCAACDQNSEILVRSLADSPVCPQCGSVKLEKLISVPAAPSMGEGSRRELPMTGPGPGACSMPRCCGGGCSLD